MATENSDDVQIVDSQTKVLENGLTFGDYNIENNSTIDLQLTDTIEIKIKDMTKQTFILQIEANDRLQQVKDLIEKKTEIPQNQQRLIFAGQSLRNDAKTLFYYNITRGSTLYLLKSDLSIGTDIYVNLAKVGKGSL